MGLTHACDKLNLSSERGMPISNEVKSDILDSLTQIRDTSVQLLEIICMWRLSSIDEQRDIPLPFMWERQNYVLKIVCRDIRHYEDFVRNTLSASDAIRELHSHIAVTEIKNTTELPLNAQVDTEDQSRV